MPSPWPSQSPYWWRRPCRPSRFNGSAPIPIPTRPASTRPKSNPTPSRPARRSCPRSRWGASSTAAPPTSDSPRPRTAARAGRMASCPAPRPSRHPRRRLPAGQRPVVAFDARHNVWLISYPGLFPNGPAGTVDVLVSRSTDGGLTWGNPIVVNTDGHFNDKNWTACDNTPSSPFFGNCYTEFDDNTLGDLIQMSTSTDGGLTWGPALPTANNAHGIGGQPLVQPNGNVIVPINGFAGVNFLSSPSPRRTVARAGARPTCSIGWASTCRWRNSRQHPASVGRDRRFRHSLRRLAGLPLRAQMQRERPRA